MNFVVKALSLTQVPNDNKDINMTDSRDQQERFLDNQYKDEKIALERRESFKKDAVQRVEDCLENNGDLVDLINTLDLEYSASDSLLNEQICEIVRSAKC